MNKIREFLGCDIKTTLFGLVGIIFAGIALIFGKLNFEQFMMLLGLLGVGGGLIAARDSRKANCDQQAEIKKE
jgi:type IV secretory pathway VirB2 component (pilin)